MSDWVKTLLLIAMMTVGLAIAWGYYQSTRTVCVDGRELFDPDETGSAFVFCDDDGDGKFERSYPR